MSDPVTATIESAITECEAHRQKLEQGETRLSGVFPLTESRLAGLDEQTVTLNGLLDGWRDLAEMYRKARSAYERAAGSA
mgnify:CR=1 FL=1